MNIVILTDELVFKLLVGKLVFYWENVKVPIVLSGLLKNKPYM